MSVPPLYHTGQSIHLPHIIRHSICLVFPRPLTPRISRIWTRTSLSNGFTLSRSTHHRPMSRHIKGNPLRLMVCMEPLFILLHTCTTQIRPHLPFASATLPTLQTLNQHGLQRNYIASQDAVISAITSILSNQRKMVCSLTMGNFWRPLAPTLLSLRLYEASPLTAHHPNISTLSISTLHSETACQLAVTSTPLFLSIAHLDSIGVLDSSLFTTMISLRGSWRFGQRPIVWLANSSVTCRLWPPLLAVTVQMALLSHTGRSWCICWNPQGWVHTKSTLT